VLAPALTFDLLLAGSRKLQLLDAFLRQLREQSPQEKVVVVSNFTSMLALVQKLAAHRRWNALSLTGATAPRDRQALVERFNRADDPSFLFLLSSRAGGTGLSIIGGSRLVMLDPDWNPSTDHQALSRIWRDGQTRPVFVYRLATVATVEQTIFSRQHGKGLLARLVSEPAESLGACFDDVESMRAIASPAIESVCTGKESHAADPADPVLQSLRLGVGGDPLFPKWIFRVDIDEAQTALHS
jgi:SNF2 family DNA or RNA helicase